MKRHVILLFLLAAAIAQAQQASDAIRYSFLIPGGTARFTAVGGSMSALGADFSTLSTNPAGLANYRKNELVVTPSLRFNNTDASLNNAVPWNENRTAFNIDNAGLVFHSRPRDTTWRTLNVGIGVNRQNDFNQNIYYQGAAQGTILNGWFAEANSEFNSGVDPEDFYPFTSGLAYDAEAIYFIDDQLTYDFEGNENAVIDRTHYVNVEGGMNEMVMSMAANYRDRLSMGVTFGVPFINYRLNASYTEEDPGGAVDGNVPYFDNLTYTDYLRTEGVGFNFKLGLIYRVTQALRLGGAFHSPTWYGMTDTYDNTLNYSYADGSGPNSTFAQSPFGAFDYKLRTPWRASGSLGVLVKKNGFLSAEVEWVDYSSSEFNLTSTISTPETVNLERELNNEISRNYRTAMNIKVGGELALDQLRLRAGVNLLGNPNEGDTDYRMAYTGGIGYRMRAFYVDLAYRYMQNDGVVTAYGGAPTATTVSTNNNFMLTLGFNF